MTFLIIFLCIVSLVLLISWGRIHPFLASLSVTFGFLPPHPSPTALVVQFHANMGLTLLYGLIISIPAIVIAGPLFSRTLKNIHSVPLETFQPASLSTD